jgi:gamma-glutamyltranspeptidase/glutathione hydrolase
MDWRTPYPSQRSPVLARHVVATSQPLAAQAGLRAMQDGGNAVDAALAAAITLTVVEPNNNGIGSDAFAIVWEGGRLHGLDASGRSPAAWTPERFAGRDRMPDFGWDTVTVPGAVSAWAALSRRFGALPFQRLFEAAIGYAREGFPVGPLSATYWGFAERMYEGFPDFAAHFLPGGRAPRAGEIFRCPDTADTLEEIARTDGESFYRGRLAERIVACAEQAGGALTLADLADHRAEWVEPVAQPYRDATLHEIPPAGQGIAAQIALGILARHDLAGLPVDSAESIHLQVEAFKLAWAEAVRHVADRDHLREPPAALLDPARLDAMAARVDPAQAAPPTPAVASAPDTVYLATADDEGRMVSWIQSNFLAFGSGVVVPGTGIHLQNRGRGFTLEPGHPNRVGPRKRPFHTIIPGFVTRDGRPWLAFGVMGGHMQAQGHVQMLVRLVDHDQNPQAACDAPRWHLREDGALLLEPGHEPAVIDVLRARGHAVVLDAMPHVFGGAQLVLALDDAWCAASDKRKEGQAVGF